MKLWAFSTLPRRSRLAISGLACAGFGGLWAAAQSSESFDAAFRALKRNDALQFELPEPPPEAADEQSDPPTWLEWLGNLIEGIFQFLAPFFEYIFYGLLILSVGTILYFVLREVIRIRRPAPIITTDAPAAQAPLYAPTTDEARVLLETVDALAAKGLYAEAVHTLLYRSIQDIDLKRPNMIRRSLTSREIAGLDILKLEARQAFSLIGRVVEASYFGGQPLGEADFQKCRAAYEQFAVPKAWAA